MAVHGLAERVARAIGARRSLLAGWHAQDTDCYRLLHGIAEGAPGVTIDRYGPLLLLQTFREPLPGAEVDAVHDRVARELGVGLAAVCNHRGPPPATGFAEHVPTAVAAGEHVGHERGTKFLLCGRHRGQDPWLFLDLRAGRARLQHEAARKRVLNLFAYTCGAGVVAARAGATFVRNVDFAASALAVGAHNVALNGLAPERCALLQSDCLPILRQLAGQPVQRRGKHVPYVRIDREPYDWIVLDPPRFAKGPFGTVDVQNDYASLFKPALLALTPGGTVLATNHVPAIDASAWHEQLRRCAQKAGRPLRSLEPIPVDADFPSFDGNPPLKMVVAAI